MDAYDVLIKRAADKRDRTLEAAKEGGSFTRLTNGHSKSLEHHAAMQAVFFCFYNFCRKHETIKQSPAQASGLAGKQWTILELLERVA